MNIEAKLLESVIADLEAIATGMTSDLTPANIANIALDKLTATPFPQQPTDALAAAVKRVIALAPESKPIAPYFVKEGEIRSIHDATDGYYYGLHHAYWVAAELLKAALTAGEKTK